MPLTTDADIRKLLETTRTIALVGASNRPERASFGVMKALQAHGYRVIPINPSLAGTEINGEIVLPDLGEVTVPIDLVDVFRNSDAAGEIVDAAIDAGAKAVWMQLGVVNEAAAARAEAAGLKVVMDRCPKIEMARLGLGHLS